MFSLPLLIDEDMAVVDGALAEFVASSGSRLALVIDGGGFVVTKRGEPGEMDITTLGALAANSFAATQAIAKIIEDHSVTSLYQEGKVNSLLMLSIGEFGFLAVVFPAEIGVGSVKFYAQEIVAGIGRQFEVAQSRAPAEGLDLASLNLADAGPLFHRRASQGV
jgi:predicted regulator of Ras-like GTPase activity (Roadblock/LC7/MglB family)